MSDKIKGYTILIAYRQYLRAIRRILGAMNYDLDVVKSSLKEGDIEKAQGYVECVEWRIAKTTKNITNLLSKEKKPK